MQLTEAAVAILSPCEMKKLKKEFAITLRTLSLQTGISTAQLSEYMAGKNGLSETQVRRCEEVLLATAREKSQVIARLLGPEIAA